MRKNWILKINKSDSIILARYSSPRLILQVSVLEIAQHKEIDFLCAPVEPYGELLVALLKMKLIEIGVIVESLNRELKLQAV